MMRPTLVVALALVLTGCAPGNATYTDDTAADLQHRVLAVSEAAAASDLAETQLKIDELTAAAENARARGELTEERHRSIMAAIGLVEADVTAAVAEQARLTAEEAARVQLEQQKQQEQQALLQQQQQQQNANNGEKGQNKDKGKGKGKPSK